MLYSLIIELNVRLTWPDFHFEKTRVTINYSLLRHLACNEIRTVFKMADQCMLNMLVFICTVNTTETSTVSAVSKVLLCLPYRETK